MLIRDSGSRGLQFSSEKDIIYFSGSRSYLKYWGREWKCNVDFKGLIEHLAIDMFLYMTRTSLNPSFPSLIVAEFPKLQSLTLVHDYRLVATKYRQQAPTKIVLYGASQVFVIPLPSVQFDHDNIKEQFSTLTPKPFSNIAFKSYKSQKDSNGHMILEDCVFAELEPPNTLETDHNGALVKADGPVGRNLL